MASGGKVLNGSSPKTATPNVGGACRPRPAPEWRRRRAGCWSSARRRAARPSQGARAWLHGRRRPGSSRDAGSARARSPARARSEARIQPRLRSSVASISRGPAMRRRHVRSLLVERIGRGDAGRPVVDHDRVDVEPRCAIDGDHRTSLRHELEQVAARDRRREDDAGHRLGLDDVEVLVLLSGSSSVLQRTTEYPPPGSGRPRRGRAP